MSISLLRVSLSDGGKKSVLIGWAMGIGIDWILHISSGIRITVISHGPTEVLLVIVIEHGI